MKLIETSSNQNMSDDTLFEDVYELGELIGK